MVMRISLMIAFICLSLSSVADTTFVQPRLIRATATLAPGYTMKAPTTSFYLHGFLEYFPEHRISLRGDGMWFLSNNQDYMTENSKLLAGIFYHFPIKQHDIYAGLQPGISFCKPGEYVTNPELKVCPVAGLTAGYTFYVWDYINFFAEGKFLLSSYHGSSIGSINMNEIVFSAGLGFQLRNRKCPSPCPKKL